jgi:hypothetical protein
VNIYQRLTKIFTALSIILVFSIIISNAQSSIYTLPIGTKIRLKMDNEINSKVSSVNDTFTAIVSSPVIIKGVELVPIGSVVEGKIIRVKAASSGKSDGNLEVKFETLRFPDDEKRQIDAGLINKNLIENKSSAFTAISIFSGTAIGAVLGAVVGKRTGAAIGAGIGAGAGTATAFLRKGKEAQIKANQEFEIILHKEVTVPVKDF